MTGKHPTLRSLAGAVAFYVLVMGVALLILRYVRFY